MPSSRTAVLAGLAVTMLIWSGQFIVMKHALSYLDPTAVTGFRVGSVAILTLPLLALPGPRLRGRSLAFFFLLAFLSVTVNQFFFIRGLSRTTPAHSAFIVALIPVFTILLSHLYLRERFTWLRLCGLALALGGTAALVGETGAMASSILEGDLLTLATAPAFALFTVLGKGAIERFGAARSTAVLYLLGWLQLLPITAGSVAAAPWRSLPLSAWASLGYISLLGALAAYLVYTWALKRVTPSEASMFTYLQPVAASSLSWIFFGERFGARFLAGAASILAGLFLFERIGKRPSLSRSDPGALVGRAGRK